MQYKKKNKHPLEKCCHANYILVCTSIIQTFSLIYILLVLILWYQHNKPAIDSVVAFPWVAASKDATNLYMSLKTYDSRKTLDDAKETVDTLKDLVKKQNKPLEKIAQIIDAYHQDRDVIHHAKNIILKLYKPIETVEDSKDDVASLIHNIKIQTDQFQPDEIHELIKNLILIINKMKILFKEENVENFFNTLLIVKNKLNAADIKEVNKLVKDTDVTVNKIDKVSKALNSLLPHQS